MLIASVVASVPAPSAGPSVPPTASGSDAVAGAPIPATMSSNTPDASGGNAVVGTKPDGVVPSPAQFLDRVAPAPFKSLFDDVVPSIVVGVMPRMSALTSPEQRRAFVEYGVDRLSHLTLGDAGRLGLEPAQYELRRRQYFAVPASPVVQSPATVADTAGKKHKKAGFRCR